MRKQRPFYEEGLYIHLKTSMTLANMREPRFESRKEKKNP